VTDKDERDGKEGPPPGGDAMQRRRAFLEKRGLPLDEEVEETEDEPTEDEDDQPDEATPPEPDEGSDPG